MNSTLPVGSVSAAPAALPDTSKAAGILIVDDDPDNLTLLGELLHAEYRVYAANSGQQALEVANAEPQPDLILLDVMMPGTDGYEVLRRLQGTPATQDIPVIFVTAMDSIDDERVGLALGAVDYLTKPLRPPIVLARVRTHLKLKRAGDMLRNQNEFLEAEVARRTAENRMIQDISIRALACLAETRDPETGNHLRRTQNYVRALALRLKHHPRFSSYFTGRNIDEVARSAPLHDIGKVGIPDSVLLKPGPLTPAEWNIMKTHSRIGAEAIAHAERDADLPAPFLKFAKEIAHYHHERWDGAGYPEGLTGEAIPVAARLMAIADVFDALTSPRPYKAAMPFAQAREIIAEQRGRHFDPDMVDAFLADFAEFTTIAQRYRDGTETANAAVSPGSATAAS